MQPMKMTALYERISARTETKESPFRFFGRRNILKPMPPQTALKTAGIIRTTDSADETLNVRAGSR